MILSVARADTGSCSWPAATQAFSPRFSWRRENGSSVCCRSAFFFLFVRFKFPAYNLVKYSELRSCFTESPSLQVYTKITQAARGATLTSILVECSDPAVRSDSQVRGSCGLREAAVPRGRHPVRLQGNRRHAGPRYRPHLPPVQGRGQGTRAWGTSAFLEIIPQFAVFCQFGMTSWGCVPRPSLCSVSSCVGCITCESSRMQQAKPHTFTIFN